MLDIIFVVSFIMLLESLMPSFPLFYGESNYLLNPVQIFLKAIIAIVVEAIAQQTQF